MRDLAVKIIPVNWGARPSQFQLPVNAVVVAVKRFSCTSIMFTFDPEASFSETWQLMFADFTEEGTKRNDIGDGWVSVPVVESTHSVALVRRLTQ